MISKIEEKKAQKFNRKMDKTHKQFTENNIKNVINVRNGAQLHSQIQIKKILRYYLSFMLAKTQKCDHVSCWQDCRGSRPLYTLLVGMQSGTTSMEGSSSTAKKPMHLPLG